MCEAGRESSGRLLTYPRSSRARWIESWNLSKSLVEMESRWLHWTAASHPPADISHAGAIDLCSRKSVLRIIETP